MVPATYVSGTVNDETVVLPRPLMQETRTLVKRIDTDLIANSVQEIDNLWRVIAHRMVAGWSYFGNLATAHEQGILRERAFENPPTISVITGKSPDGDGYVLYARKVPLAVLAARTRDSQTLAHSFCANQFV